jgi:serine protease Do
MDQFDDTRYRADRPAAGPASVPFSGAASPPPRRLTTPLPELPPQAYPQYIPPAPYAPAPQYIAPAPPASARRGRRGFSGALLAGMLILGLLAGGVGGGATAWMLAGGSSPAPVAAPAAAPAATAAAQPPRAVADTSPSSIGALYNRVRGSVVDVRVVTGGGRFSSGGEGTGVVLDSGHVLTNNHVIEGATSVRVYLEDGTSVDAKVLGTAPQDDLAVLEASLPAGKVTPATLGDSDAVRVGDEVVAVGNPFGLDHTVTAGIVSAVNRSWSEPNQPVRPMIQTDAPINPGNSGGPLFNMAGEVIGITTAIESPVRGSVGIGFAIPSNRAKSLAPQLTAGTKVQRVWLGIQGSALDDQMAKAINAPVNKGVLVVGVTADSPAAKAGLQGSDPTTSATLGDIITAVDSVSVGKVEDITGYLEGKKTGDVVTLTILRDGKQQQVKVTLAPWPEQAPQSDQTTPPGMPNDPNAPGTPTAPQRGLTRAWLGITGQPLDAALAAQLKVSITKGVLITQVTPQSPAAAAGLRGAAPESGTVGDIITAVEGQSVGTVADIASALAGKQPGDVVTVTVWRDGKSQDVKVTLAERTNSAPNNGGGLPFPFPGDPNGGGTTP